MIRLEIGGRTMTVCRLEFAVHAQACARIMSTSEPWVTLGRDFDASLAIITASDHEAYVVLDDEEVAGFVVLCMHGALVGYLKSIVVRADWRSRGLGRQLMAFAEDRIVLAEDVAFATAVEHEHHQAAV